MSDLFQDYSVAAERSGAYDEMFTPEQQPRQSYGQVAEALRELSLADVTARADSMARTFLDRGVTFDFAGEERPFPLDIVPRVIPAHEWTVMEKGVAEGGFDVLVTSACSGLIHPGVKLLPLVRSRHTNSSVPRQYTIGVNATE